MMKKRLERERKKVKIRCFGTSSQFIGTIQFSALRFSSMNKLEEFTSGFGIISKVTQHTTGDSFTSGFLNTSHNHTHMGCLYNNPNTSWIDCG